MTTDNRVTPEQAAELARMVGEMFPEKCSSAIHPACNRPSEYYIETIHDCQQLPVKVWPVCAVVVQSLGQNVVDGSGHGTSGSRLDYAATFACSFIRASGDARNTACVVANSV